MTDQTPTASPAAYVERPCTLGDCPPGLFRFGGTLGFKTEYCAMETVGPVEVPGSQVRWRVGRWPDAYVVESGEYFWGGASNHDDRAKLIVTPVAALSAQPPAEATDRVERLEAEIARLTPKPTPHDDLAGVCYRSGPITASDYDECIADMQAARQALTEGDSMGCVICSDGGCASNVCHHNALRLARKWAAATRLWQCWHCGYIATTDQEGREHFGRNECDEPACIAALAQAPERDGEGWMPIETAPDTEIDLWCEALDGDGWLKRGDLVSFDPQCLRTDEGDLYYPHENGGYFTHWRPLPVPPTPSPTSNGGQGDAEEGA